MQSQNPKVTQDGLVICFQRAYWMRCKANTTVDVFELEYLFCCSFNSVFKEDCEEIGQWILWIKNMKKGCAVFLGSESQSFMFRLPDCVIWVSHWEKILYYLRIYHSPLKSRLCELPHNSFKWLVYTEMNSTSRLWILLIGWFGTKGFLHSVKQISLWLSKIKLQSFSMRIFWNVVLTNFLFRSEPKICLVIFCWYSNFNFTITIQKKIHFSQAQVLGNIIILRHLILHFKEL